MSIQRRAGLDSDILELSVRFRQMQPAVQVSWPKILFIEYLMLFASFAEAQQPKSCFSFNTISGPVTGTLLPEFTKTCASLTKEYASCAVGSTSLKKGCICKQGVLNAIYGYAVRPLRSIPLI